MLHYKNRYPRSGQRALLCEGDVAGYEVDLLVRWTARFPELGLVDVWPCGTKTAIYGITDAIGRSIPTFVIEDRDHRTPLQATKDCRANAKDRVKRGVQIGFWRAWSRSEVENYFLEPAILHPVLCKVFGVSRQTVEETLQEVVASTVVDQALQMSLSEFRTAFPDGPSSVGGVPRATGRPCCDENGLRAPDAATVEALLEEVLNNALAKVEPEKFPDRKSCISAFQRRIDEWNTITIDNLLWKVEWAGKEVLGLVRAKLAGEVGWPDENGQRIPVKWSALCRAEAGEWDRKIERALQPRFVKQFLDELTAQHCSIPDILEEWNSLICGLRDGFESGEG